MQTIVTWRVPGTTLTAKYTETNGNVPDYKKNTRGFVSESIYQDGSWAISNPDMISYYTELESNHRPAPVYVLSGIRKLIFE